MAPNWMQLVTGLVMTFVNGFILGHYGVSRTDATQRCRGHIVTREYNEGIGATW